MANHQPSEPMCMSEQKRLMWRDSSGNVMFQAVGGSICKWIHNHSNRGDMCSICISTKSISIQAYGGCHHGSNPQLLPVVSSQRPKAATETSGGKAIDLANSSQPSGAAQHIRGVSENGLYTSQLCGHFHGEHEKLTVEFRGVSYFSDRPP